MYVCKTVVTILPQIDAGIQGPLDIFSFQYVTYTVNRQILAGELKVPIMTSKASWRQNKNRRWQNTASVVLLPACSGYAQVPNTSGSEHYCWEQAVQYFLKVRLNRVYLKNSQICVTGTVILPTEIIIYHLQEDNWVNRTKMKTALQNAWWITYQQDMHHKYTAIC